MKPFVSNHSLFHPTNHLVEFLNAHGLSFLNHRLSGLSLKYLRSAQPIFCFAVNQDEYQLIISSDMAKKFDSSITDHSIEITLPITTICDQETILQIFSVLPAMISTDTLIYDWQSKTWIGDSILDYECGIIRFIGNDLTIETAIQLCSMASQLDFTLADETNQRILDLVNSTKSPKLKFDFLKIQLTKIVTAAKPSQGFIALQKAGLLNLFLPELHSSLGVTQNRFHKYDVFHHLVFSCDSIERPELHLRLAGLLHDIGKVKTRRLTKWGDATFHNHEVVGAKMVQKILQRFGFDTDLIERVAFLVRNHMFHYTRHWNDRTVRRFLTRVPIKDLPDLIALRMADRQGNGKNQIMPIQIQQLLHHVEQIQKEESKPKIKDLAINGHDLKNLGISPGPIYKSLLSNLLDQVELGKINNDRQSLITALDQLLAVTKD